MAHAQMHPQGRQMYPPTRALCLCCAVGRRRHWVGTCPHQRGLRAALPQEVLSCVEESFLYYGCGANLGALLSWLARPAARPRPRR